MRRPWALILIAIALPVLGALRPAAAQPRHRITSRRNQLRLENLTTGRKTPFDMWLSRLANTLMNARFTTRVVANLDEYQRFGVNTLEISLQGGALGLGKNNLYPRVFNADGTLDLSSPVWGNLRWLLDETDKRGMVLIVQFWHQLRDQNVPDDVKAIEITRRATAWLKSTGHRHYLVDVVNEFDHGGFEIPGQKGVKRPLFSTLGGALTLIEAVKDTDPQVLVGMSPTGALLCPVGFLSNPTRWVEADLIIGHNQIADPRRPASYKLNSVPRDPTSKPYMNTEFSSQIRYEQTPRLNPRTGLNTYGHWDAATVQRYVTDMAQARTWGYANVFSHFQQYVAADASVPVAEIGPAGTQPEAAPGAAEPSVHWLFQQVARLARLRPVPATRDFNAGYAAVETNLGGTWDLAGGALHQTDPTADPAWARMVAETGDLEISCEAAFTSASDPASRLGLLLGAATPAGPAYRLLVARDRITLDEVGGTLPAKTVAVAKRATDQYVVRLVNGRLQVLVDGAMRVDVPDTAPLAGRNLLFLTKRAAARFDNVRVSPIRLVDFENTGTGDWAPLTPSDWRVVTGPGPTPTKVWEAAVPASQRRYAVLDRRLRDVELTFDVDLTEAAGAAAHLRAGNASRPGGAAYRLAIQKTGAVTLERLADTGPALLLASTRATFNPAAINVGVTIQGSRLEARLDGAVALDIVDPSSEPLDPGALVLEADAGKVRFDNLRLTVTPNRFPDARFSPGGGPPLPAGFAIAYTDPDGLTDLTGLQLLLDTGSNVFVDITFILLPALRIFQLALADDGMGVKFTLNANVPIGAARWTLRAVARDREGHTAVTDYTTNP